MAGELTGAVDRARVGGSTFTFFTWDSKLIAFAQQIAHVTPQPVAQATPIHPLNEPYPVEVITPAAAGMGTLTLQLYELYGQQVWDQLSQLTGANDIVDIFQRVANSPHPITMVKYIKPPRIRGKVLQPYAEHYHNCVITNVVGGETITIGTMEILKQITMGYTYMSRGTSTNPVLANAVSGVPSSEAAFTGPLTFGTAN